jgi:hypothetical protein
MCPSSRPLVTKMVDIQRVEGKDGYIIVQHNYHDHSKDSKSALSHENPPRGGVTTPFPLKLHEMLEAIQQDGLEDVISWQPHGRCFILRKPKEFIRMLPKYFKISKLASFQRQLNLYGFQRLTCGEDRGGYYHELFLHNRVFLAHSIQRCKVKGTKVRARSNPKQEPEFWSMPWVSPYYTTEQLQEQAQLKTPVRNNVSPVAEEVPSMVMEEERFSYPMSRQPMLPLSIHLPSSIEEKKHERDSIRPLENMTFFIMDSQDDHEEGDDVEEGEEDKVFLFENKPFHYMEYNDILPTEAAKFLQDFEFLEDFGNIEDNRVFEDLLESLVA